MKTSDAEKLQGEYQKLVEGLQGMDEGREEDTFMANPGKSIMATNFDIRHTYGTNSPAR